MLKSFTWACDECGKEEISPKEEYSELPPLPKDWFRLRAYIFQGEKRRALVNEEKVVCSVGCLEIALTKLTKHI